MFFTSVQEIYSPGTANPREDRKFVRYLPECLLACVSDGTSSPWVDAPYLYDGSTGGQKMADVVVMSLLQAYPHSSLFSTLMDANRMGAAFLKEHHIPFNPGESPGACVDMIKMTPEYLDVCHVGDTFTIVEFKDGKLFITNNQVFEHDKEMGAFFTDCMTMCGGDRREAWKLFAPYLAEARRQRANIVGEYGYPLLNGHLNLSMVRHERFPTNKVRRVFLGTDGAMPYAQSGDSMAFGKKLIELFDQRGFEAVLAYTRADEAKRRHESHIDEAEATLICIEL